LLVKVRQPLALVADQARLYGEEQKVALVEAHLGPL
jgi:hypothetical protein